MDKILKCPNCGLEAKDAKILRCIRCNSPLIVLKPCNGNCKVCGEASKCNDKA